MSTTDTQTGPVEDATVATLRERGMVTAEYVVGIIAAIALALVMLRVFKADGFLAMITDVIGGIFKTIFGLFS